MMVGSGGHREEGVRLLNLALSMHRNPAIVPIAMSGIEITEAMEILLQLTNGDPELLAWAEEVTGANKEELKRSGLGFIERVFFGVDNDPFRVLGLNPWAAPEDIKEHYRLLIRLFHPDRGVAKHVSAETYAAMINQAYSKLKKLIPANHSPNDVRYGASFGAAHANRLAPLPARIPMSDSAAAAQFSPWNFLARLTPSKVLGTVATVAMLLLAALFLQENRTTDPIMDAVKSTPVGPTESLQQAGYRSLSPEKDDHAPSLPPVTQFHSEAPASNFTSGIDRFSNVAAAGEAPSRVKVQSSDDVSSSRPSPRAARTPSLPLAEKDARHVEVDSTATYAAVPVKSETKTDDDPHTSRNLAMLDSSPVATSDARLVPSELELHHVIGQFIGSYDHGDLGSFMSLFDEKVRTDEPGGKDGLRDTYAKFFSSTLSREMVLRNLHWQRNGELAIGLADYRVSLSSSGDSAPRSSTGSLRIEVAKMGAGAMIVGYFHQTDPK